MKHTQTRWSLLLVVLILAAVQVACAWGAPQEEAAEGGVDAGPTAVNVVAKDLQFSLEPSLASAGTITFIVENEGSMPHDFAIRGNGVEHKIPMIDPGENETLTVDLEPGTYTYVCTVPGHSLLGMRGTFTVK